ncbi:AfsR/SARP family transcriptional regulator [Microbispora sp. ATCC PTA-5024]|uniref:AfsR/SARP family transcriptional regulator n=1 Tax=Microbispora sp. ATCC PTA-5024 TaxID=316330 RepID=UPI0003DBBC33|nr:AfsR/SARP family transcriptional regulator [Microbispora sp. ATCC PTA-5024]ETK37736.1 SARP family transcriptional regulator [Microbispora sp. ATCC PTA-5024]
MRVTFGVLGPVTAWDGGDAVALKGPRHRAVLARLIVARGRVVPVTHLVDDLWEDPPPDAVGAVRTFVAALRRALEPGRRPRGPARLLVTEGPGYALRATPEAVDAWRFERSVAEAAALTPGEALARLEEALGWWRGPAYAEFAGHDWTRAERSRLAELRLHAAERRAEARMALGRAGEAVPDLDAHVAEHPWREEGWRLLALALYRTGRQGDALAVLRRARTLLVEQLGVDPGPDLRRLEADILHHADRLDPDAAGPAGRVWARAAAVYDRTVASGARARLESTVGLLRTLAVTGGDGLEAAREHRVAAVAAAEELGDVELTARVIGAYDVPANWTRVDDPAQAARVVAAAERTLARLPGGAHDGVRARLLATVALESRGTRSARGAEAARQAVEIARRLNDPALLAFALNGAFMQTFHRAGLAPERDGIGAELVDLSARHGLVTYEVLGHLVRMQARSALADFDGADGHAAAADRLSERHELPLVGVFTRWYRALRLAAAVRAPGAETPEVSEAEVSEAEVSEAEVSEAEVSEAEALEAGSAEAEVDAAYRDAVARLDGAGMPGLARGLPALTLLSLRVRRGLPAEEDADWGPYEPWARPLVLLARGRREEAAVALRAAPDPPRDLLFEAMWCLTGRAAVALGDRETMERARAALAPAAGELAGAGSGLITLGPVAGHLAALSAALDARG